MQVSLTFDLDPDSSTGLVKGKKTNSWASTEFFFNHWKALGLEDKKPTFFVRADYEVANDFGHVKHWFERYSDNFTDLLSLGGGIGWHPHFASYDFKKIEEEFLDVQNELRKLNYKLEVIRIGRAYQSNELMHLIDTYGWQVDASGLPGRKRVDGQYLFDWTSSPNFPYQVSSADYRTSSIEMDSLDIWEVPMTTAPIKAPYDSKPLLRYINLAYHPGLFKDAIHRLFEINDFGNKLVVITHPHEIYENDKSELYAHSIEAFVENLGYLEQICEMHCPEFQFTDIKGLIDNE